MLTFLRPNSVKIATPLAEITARNIKVSKAYLVCYTNAQVSNLAAAAKVFRDAAKKNRGEVPRIASRVDFYIATALMPKQMIAEDASDQQVMLEAGVKALPAGYAFLEQMFCSSTRLWVVRHVTSL